MKVPHYLIISLFIAVSDFLLTEGAGKKMPNVRYLGTGYDILRGNPHNNLYDPGFTIPILDLPYTAGRKTSDHKYQVPDFVAAYQSRSCRFDSSTSIIKGSSSYRNALSVEAEVSAKGTIPAIASASFSASAGYREVKKRTSRYRSIYTSTVAKCVAYTLDIGSYKYGPVNVTVIFENAVKGLPLVHNNDAYITFITTFGTHLARYVVMGAKAVMRSEFSKSAWSSMQRSGVKVKIGASASFLELVGAAVKFSTAVERQSKNTFEKQRKSYQMSYIGSAPPKNGNLIAWARSTEKTPYPIAYRLDPIYKLITTKYFQSMRKDHLTTRRKLLYAAYKKYCQKITGECVKPKPRPVPVKMKLHQSKFLGQGYARCWSKYRPLSCGIKNYKDTGEFDVGRYALPDAKGCSCKDVKGAVCVAWCATRVTIVKATSKIKKGTYFQQCQPGYKVLSCHTKPTSSLEAYRYGFPNDWGNGCYCYDYFGTRCVATCGKGIRNHEVRSQFGKGNVVARCSRGKVVLGCGIKTHHPRPYEPWRAYHVYNKYSCKCYDTHGATCYAICGKL